MFPASSPQAHGDRPAANPRATRSVVLARNGLIATSQPLASAAGLRVLQQRGNAIDAAVTAAGFGMNIQEAGEAPRFRHAAAGLALESATSPEARFGLTQ